jgi:hypothetical protein
VGGSSLSFTELEPFMLPLALLPAGIRERHASSETRADFCARLPIYTPIS